ncbi:MAG: DUF2069 domain-containing protein [Wenzhouxiangella sp.]
MIRLSWCRWSLLALIPLQLVWYGWLNPPEIVPLSLGLALSAGPLLISLVLAWPLKPRGLVIAGLVLLIYFVIGVTEAWVRTDVLRAVALAQVVLVSLYFTALATIRRQAAKAG